MNSLDDESLRALLDNYADDRELNRKKYDQTGQEDYQSIINKSIAQIKQVIAERIPKPYNTEHTMDEFKQGYNACVATIREAFGLAYGKSDVRKEVNNGKGESEA